MVARPIEQQLENKQPVQCYTLEPYVLEWPFLIFRFASIRLGLFVRPSVRGQGTRSCLRLGIFLTGYTFAAFACWVQVLLVIVFIRSVILIRVRTIDIFGAITLECLCRLIFITKEMHGLEKRNLFLLRFRSALPFDCSESPELLAVLRRECSSPCGEEANGESCCNPGDVSILLAPSTSSTYICHRSPQYRPAYPDRSDEGLAMQMTKIVEGPLGRHTESVTANMARFLGSIQPHWRWPSLSCRHSREP